MDLQIRQARHSECGALSAVAIATYSDAFGHSFSAADLAAHLRRYLGPDSFAQILQTDVVLVAEKEGRLIGYVQFGDSDAAADDERALRRLYVAAGYQGRGVGSRLMETALAHPRLRSAMRIVLDVWEHNPRARRFYERYGFEAIGAQSFAVASGAETSRDLIMVRRQR